MVNRSLLFNICLGTFLMSQGAYAAEPLEPLNFKGRFEFGYSGLLFGKAGVEFEQDASHYKAAADIKSAGIAKLFVKHSSHTTTDAKGKTHPDIVYETTYHTNKKKHYVRLDYKKGKLASEKLDPPETSGKRPPVPMEMKQDAADLLSMIVQMRQDLYEALQKKKPGFAIKAYDGRRLMEIDFTVGDKGVYTGPDGNKTPVQAVAVHRKLLGGYTQSELDDYDPNEPTLMIYFTDDARLIPIHFEIPLPLGMLYADMVRECAANEPCLLGITE